MRRILIMLAIFVNVGISVALAQLPTGTILGTVKDTSGGAVAGATVTARNTDTSSSRTATTGEDGSYRFAAMPVGNYQIEVSHEGFSTATLTGLTLTVAQDAVMNVTLQVGSSAQSVQVTGEVPQIDTTTSSVGGLMSEQSIADLPLNGRNWNDLTLLQTGIANVSALENDVRGIGGDIFQSNGAPLRSNNYMIDGAIMQNFYGMNTASVSQQSLGVDGIKEFKTITNLFSAEYGMSMGSQTTIVSKGGTNQYHGDVFEFIRNDDLDSRNLFNPTQFVKPPFRQNQFGGSFGGPVKKDKTFFYGVYEGFRNYLGEPTISDVPAAGCHVTAPATTVSPANCPQLPSTGGNVTIGGGATNTGTVVPQVYNQILTLLNDFPLPSPGSNQALAWNGFSQTRDDYGQMRVDENISASDTLFGRFTIDDTSQPQTDNYPGINDIYLSRNQYWTASETHIISPNIINTARTSFSRTNFNSESAAPSLNIPWVTGQPAGNLVITGVTSGNLGFGPQSTNGFVIQNILTLSNDVFWTKGKHALKFGTLVNHYEQGIDDKYLLDGSVNFANFTTFLQGLTSSTSFAVPGANQDSRDYTFWTLGFYVQDDYRPMSRLTLNLGFRYEFNTTPEEKYGRQYAFVGNFATDTVTTQGPVLQNASLKNFSPRVGFAWDLFGDGKTSVRGGFGVYYDIATQGSAVQQDIIATPPLTAQGGSTGSVQLTTLPLDAQFPTALSGASAFKGIKLQGTNYYDKQPYILQYNLGIERQLPASIALTVSYIGSRGIHLWDENNGNDAAVTSMINGNEFYDPCLPAGSGGNPANGSGTTSTGCKGLLRINPYYGAYSEFATSGDSFYNSLQVGLAKRLTRGLQFQASYTYGKLIDTPQGQTSTHDVEIAGFVDPYNPRFDKGPGEADATHQLQINTVYHFPIVTREKFASKLLNGWWVGNIMSIQSGFAFSPTVSITAPSGLPGAGRPDIVTAANVAAVRAGTYTRDGILGGANPNAAAYKPATVITHGINEFGNTGVNAGWFNPNMFIAPPPGLLGDAPRGMLRGPDLRNWNFSLVKDTRLAFLGEGGNLQFRAEFFNVLNHGNFAQPGGGTYTSGPIFTGEGVVENSGTTSATGASILSSTTGQIVKTSTTTREIQFGLRVEF